MKVKAVFNSTSLVVISITLLSIGIYSCNGSKTSNGITRDACMDTIKTIEKKLRATQIPDTYTYNRAITAYTLFASSFPTDSASPACLFNAANIAMSINQYQKSINLFDTITVKYPTFKRMIYCYFNRGYIYDDKLKDTAKAHVFYQMVIDKYPNDTVLTPQARASIANLGKSYDEIIKEFQEKNKAQKKS